MITQEDRELVSKLLIMWIIAEQRGQEEDYPYIKEVHDEDFICKVLSKRMEAFDLQIIVPDYLSSILSMCTEQNPGKSLYLLYEILKETEIKSLPYTVQSLDFSRIYPMSFPFMEGEFDKEYHKKWMSQKYDNDKNKIDTPRFWKEAIGGYLYE